MTKAVKIAKLVSVRFRIEDAIEALETGTKFFDIEALYAASLKIKAVADASDSEI